jgi:hypothetical protein
VAGRAHFIERLDNFTKLERRKYESGYWNLPVRTAELLIGGDIYFHKFQKEPSFFGGKILGFRVHHSDDEYDERVIFTFEFTPEHRGVRAGEGGWSYEKKIVLGE